MGEEVIFQDREIRHGSIDHRGERTITIFRDDNITTPCIFLLERTALDVLDGLVDWKWHPVTRYSWVKYDIRISELPVHAVERFHELQKYLVKEGTNSCQVPKR